MQCALAVGLAAVGLAALSPLVRVSHRLKPSLSFGTAARVHMALAFEVTAYRYMRAHIPIPCLTVFWSIAADELSSEVACEQGRAPSTNSALRVALAVCVLAAIQLMCVSVHRARNCHWSTVPRTRTAHACVSGRFFCQTSRWPVRALVVFSVQAPVTAW